jgi:RIO kinase 1
MSHNKIKDYYDYDEANNERVSRFKQSRRNPHALLDEKASVIGLENLGASAAFTPSLGSSRHEREWIFTYLSVFYDNQVITDVVRRVKGGKEANVYVCLAHNDVGLELLAAKLYRPRLFRNLRNDSRYRDRRTVLDEHGKPVTNRGALRALAGGSSFGQDLRQISWLQHEYQTLELLHSAGVPVPKPITSGENTILMEYVGDIDRPAPSLAEISISKAQARKTFDILIDSIERMLAHSRIHADLSAYNVLFWDNKPVIIDFPQAVDPRQNPDAWPIFSRDVERICQYFSRYDIRTSAYQLARSIWDRHSKDLAPLTAQELDTYVD